ncbi:MAG: heavy metal translocating P-type ATPase metal-binding domain-containing protein [Acidobacteria bacterium]|nr:heavy metal translocating P-type ATPase metal-binding domain-containing protein [Acidobacteriota bacterium]
MCRHCGDPCDRRAIVSDAGTFCCGGCESVFALLSTHGMTAFYTCDVRPGTSQRAVSERDPARFAPLDDAEVARRFVTPRAAGLLRVVFPTPSMHCASCLWLLEQLWRFHPGIVRSEANLMNRTVAVEFKPTEISLRAVAEQLAALGYEPVLDQEPSAGVPAVRRSLYLKIGVAGFAFGNVMLFSIPRYANGAPLDPQFQTLFGILNLVFSLPVLLFSAADYFRAAWSAARARAITLDVPIALGLAVLFGRSAVEIIVGSGEGFLDSFSGLVFFLLIGKLFQQKAFESITFERTVQSFLPLSVRVERETGVELTRVETLRPGDTITIRPQEVVPADAVLLDEHGAIDYAFVTGEQAPVEVLRGAIVHAGGRVTGRALRMQVARAVSNSRLAQLWSDPVFAHEKAHWLTGLLARFGWWFTVVAMGLAVVGAVAWWPDARKAAEVATAVLIIACPCAFTLAAPITLGTAMGVLGRAGFYLKQSAVALDLSRIDTIAFDKTGTLTTAAADATVSHSGFTDAHWRLVRRLAAHSVHPVSRAIAGDLIDTGLVTEVVETAGRGVSGLVDGHRVVIGAASFVSSVSGRAVTAEAGADLVTWAAVDASAGTVRLMAPDRAGMPAATAAIAARYTTWLLSGDHATEAARWQPAFGARMKFRQTPEDKLATVRAEQAAHHRVLMVGDGLNDAGALAAADVGIAVSDETACLVPACDAVIRGDRLPKLPVFLAYARRSQRVIVICFLVSIAYNALGLGLALMGVLTPLATAILMPVSSLTIVGLSVGLMRRGTKEVLS